MPVAQSIRHVPWTCRWGRFGGPVLRADEDAPGFLFWVCDHPALARPLPRVLNRQQCAQCPLWERADEAGSPAGNPSGLCHES
jgi:hypothetical protein